MIFSRRQRLVALFYGLLCHLSFGGAISVMAFSLFTGLRFGLGPFHGTSAGWANGLLLLSFPLFHSFLLSAPGRRVLHRCAPLGLGRPLSSTIFALISSVQIATIFLAWSPSGVRFWDAGVGLRWGIGVLAAAAWLLLMKSMSDAHLALQTGWLGWWSVFRGRPPMHRPFATQGVYRYVRQPIYISFAALLWLAADGTPDQVALAGLWTGYCIAGSALKERRFLRYFGDSFRHYQQQVPFWIPRKPLAVSRSTPPATSFDADVVIAGGGPVGLVLASLLGMRGLRVVVAERRRAPPAGSMAIGITPPSLEVLRHLGLDTQFMSRGVRIDRAFVQEAGVEVGSVDFSKIPSLHRFILSLPQQETVSLLEAHARSFPNVTMIRGLEFATCAEDEAGLTSHFRDVESKARVDLRSRFLIGCDGHRSTVREAAGITVSNRSYRTRFMMADFEDQTLLGPDAHLFFGPDGSVESFPLPGGKRRWIVQLDDLDPTDPRSADPAGVATCVHARTGYELSGSSLDTARVFAPVRMLARRYARGRIALCGDAAHVMSPIGGQGMNTGIADAAHLARVLAEGVATGCIPTAALDRYGRVRRRAFRSASMRSALGMWMGTRRGRVASSIRAFLLHAFLGQEPVRASLAQLFAMLSVPGSRELTRHLKGMPT